MLLTSFAIAAALLAQPAAAGAAATLVEPREARMNLDGRNWSCDTAGQCVGRGGGASQPLMRECRRFVARFGAVSAFSRDGMALTEAELVQCNAAAA
ncbi:MAG: hypothetical protein A2623_11455 [Caulobacterales bacterium RIFCSPHIGHO2_01_FULL_70_19]|jgi:hypothetical protein|nr:MAG: hypothetical protein A2623_11455 [Caulobacterales bacterium RIFCSPHIGHO2_01_FULL_70_19]